MGQEELAAALGGHEDRLIALENTLKIVMTIALGATPELHRLVRDAGEAMAGAVEGEQKGVADAIRALIDAD